MLARGVAAGVLAVFGAPSSASVGRDVWLDLAPDLTCPSPSSLVAAVEAGLGREHVHRDAAPERAITLRVVPHGGNGATLAFVQDGAVLVERTLDVVAADCERLAQTLALVAETWLPTGAGDDLKETRLPEGEAPEAPAPPSEGVVKGSEPPPADAKPVAPEVPAREEPARVTLAPTRNTPVQDHRRERQFAVEASAGAAIAADTGAGATGLLRLGVERDFHPWLGGLRANLQTLGGLPVNGTGSVTTRRTSTDAFLGLDVVRAARGDAALLVALGVEIVSAHVEGFAALRDDTFIEGNASAGARARWFAWPLFALTTTVDGSYAWQRESFRSNGGLIAESPHFRCRVTGGVAWSPF